MPVEKAPRIRNRRLWIYGSVAAAVAAVAILAGVRLTRASPNAEAFQRFWDPILQSEEPLLVAAAHAIASTVTDSELNANYVIPSVFHEEVHKAVAAAVKDAAQAAGS